MAVTGSEAGGETEGEVRTGTPTLAEARRVVDRERRECVAEREAFRSFRAAVSRLSTPEGGSDASQPTQGSGVLSARCLQERTGASASGGAAPIRDAYRRSVMALDHLGEESLSEHMAAELGAGLARRIEAGAVTPAVRRALRDRIDVVVDARESFVAMLDREVDSIEGVDGTCRRLRSRVRRVRAWESVDDERRRLDAAFEAWTELDRIAAALDEAAADRQATLARHRRSLTGFDEGVASYLYDGRPALAAIASVGRDAVDGRRAVVAAVGHPE